MQEAYTYVQSLGAIITFSTSLIISYIVLKKDYRYSLNILFASAVLTMGLSMIFLIFSNLYPIIYNENGPSFFLQFSYQFIVFSLLLFAVCLAYINFGKRVIRFWFLHIYIVLSIIACTYVIWFTSPFYSVGLGDVNSTTLFKIVVLMDLVISYLITLFLTLFVYKGLEGEVKDNLKAFLIGWLVGGLALIMNVLGDYAHILDILTQVVLTIAIVLIFRSFNRETARRRQHQ